MRGRSSTPSGIEAGEHEREGEICGRSMQLRALKTAVNNSPRRCKKRLLAVAVNTALPAVGTSLLAVFIEPARVVSISVAVGDRVAISQP